MDNGYENRVTPGIHPSCRLDGFSEEEKKIVLTFSKMLYVTHTNGGNYICVTATSKYKYFIIKPTETFCHQFNLEREIVVVLSDFNQFEPRTLDAFDYIYKNQPALRLDKACIVLISKDANIIETITTLLKSDVDMISIIPFSYDELLINGNQSFILNRFRRFFYERDLFDFDQAIQNDTYFFGRRDYVNEVYNKVISGENSGVFGLRKMGKTSVLLAVERLLNKNEGCYLKLDCQSLCTMSWNNVLYAIISELVNKYDLSIAIDQKSFDYEMAALSFGNKIMEIFKYVGAKRIVLMLDEIEHLSHGVSSEEKWSSGKDFINFWRALRSCFQNHSNMFGYILFGTNPIMFELPYINIGDKSIENPMFNGVQISYLAPFDIAHTKAMIKTLGGYMGLIFNDETCAIINQDLGGHPFLIRQCCSLINKQIKEQQLEKPVQIQRATYERIKNEFAQGKGRTYSVMILDVLINHYKGEYYILENLAANNYVKVRELVTDATSVSHLIGYGIVEKNNNNYCFKLKIVDAYLNNKSKYSTLILTREEKLAEINERRNSFEPKLRNMLQTQITATFGETCTRQKVLSILKKDRERQLHLYNIDKLFDALLISELILLVKNHWECIKNLVSISLNEMQTYLYALNNYRRPAAHGYSIDEKDFNNFRLVMQQLEEQIK